MFIIQPTNVKLTTSNDDLPRIVAVLRDDSIFILANEGVVAEMSSTSRVRTVRKCHNHTLQTNPRHRKEEPQNTNRESIKVKQPAQL